MRVLVRSISAFSLLVSACGLAFFAASTLVRTCFKRVSTKAMMGFCWAWVADGIWNVTDMVWIDVIINTTQIRKQHRSILRVHHAKHIPQFYGFGKLFHIFTAHRAELLEEAMLLFSTPYKSFQRTQAISE